MIKVIVAIAVICAVAAYVHAVNKEYEHQKLAKARRDEQLARYEEMFKDILPANERPAEQKPASGETGGQASYADMQAAVGDLARQMVYESQARHREEEAARKGRRSAKPSPKAAPKPAPKPADARADGELTAQDVRSITAGRDDIVGLGIKHPLS